MEMGGGPFSPKNIRLLLLSFKNNGNMKSEVLK